MDDKGPLAQKRLFRIKSDLEEPNDVDTPKHTLPSTLLLISLAAQQGYRLPFSLEEAVCTATVSFSFLEN